MHDAATLAPTPGAGRALSREQFAVYAQEQIRAATALLAPHHPASGVCACGRALPCSSAAALARTVEYFRDRLAVADPAGRHRPALADRVGAANDRTA